MKFGIIFVLMMVIGQLVDAAPSWMTPEMQEQLAILEAENARIYNATRPERVAEVIVALDAEIARLERLPRSHRYSDNIRNVFIPHLKQDRKALTNCDEFNSFHSMLPTLLYANLRTIRFNIYTTSKVR